MKTNDNLKWLFRLLRKKSRKTQDGFGVIPKTKTFRYKFEQYLKKQYRVGAFGSKNNPKPKTPDGVIARNTYFTKQYRIGKPGSKNNPKGKKPPKFRPNGTTPEGRLEKGLQPKKKKKYKPNFTIEPDFIDELNSFADVRRIQFEKFIDSITFERGLPGAEPIDDRIKETVVIPNFQAPLVNMLLAMDISKTDKKILLKNPEESPLYNLFLENGQLNERLFNFGPARLTNPDIKSKERQGMIKYARELGYSLKPYIIQDPIDYQRLFAEHVLRHRKDYPQKEIERALYYMTLGQQYGPPPVQRFAFFIKHGTTKLFNKGNPVYQMVMELVKASSRADRPYYKKGAQIGLKENNYLLADYEYARAKGGKSFLELVAQIQSTASYTELNRRITQDLEREAILTGESNYLKGSAKHDNVDQFYSIGKGRKRIAYDDLIQYIKLNKEFIVDPPNLEALRNSVKFRTTLVNRLGPEGGEKRVVEFYEKEITKGEASHNIIDETRTLNMKHSVHKIKITPKGKKSFFVPYPNVLITYNDMLIHKYTKNEHKRFKNNPKKRAKAEREYKRAKKKHDKKSR